MDDSEIYTETKKSSTLRLLCEILRWDENNHDQDLNVIAEELSKRSTLTTLKRKLFLIAIANANFGSAFKEDFYVFDNDEKETRRLLRTNIGGHLIGLFLAIFCWLLFGKWVGLVLTFLYFIMTIKMAFDNFQGPYRRLKKSATNST